MLKQCTFTLAGETCSGDMSQVTCHCLNVLLDHDTGLAAGLHDPLSSVLQFCVLIEAGVKLTITESCSKPSSALLVALLSSLTALGLSRNRALLLCEAGKSLGSGGE